MCLCLNARIIFRCKKLLVSVVPCKTAWLLWLKTYKHASRLLLFCSSAFHCACIPLFTHVHLYFDTFFIGIFEFPCADTIRFIFRFLFRSFWRCAPDFWFDRMPRTIVCHAKIEKPCFFLQSTEHFLHKQTRVDHDIVMFWWWRSSPFGLLSASPLFLCCDITVLSTLNKYHSCSGAGACVRNEAKEKRIFSQWDCILIC